MRQNEIEGKRRTEMERTFLRLWLAVFVCVLCRVNYRVSGLYRAIALTGTGSTKQTLCSVAFSSLLSYAFYLNLFEVGTHEKKNWVSFPFNKQNNQISYKVFLWIPCVWYILSTWNNQFRAIRFKLYLIEKWLELAFIGNCTIIKCKVYVFLYWIYIRF